MFISSLNKRLVGYLLGIMLMWLGAMCIIPAVVSLYFVETDARIFILTFLVFVLLGFTFTYICKEYNRIITKRDGQISVGFMWIIIPLLGSMPYMFFPDVFSISDSIFESYSGFTTTGSTIIEDFSKVPKGLLVYRALTQWIGGLGFTLLIIMSLKHFPGSFNNLFNAEFFSINSGKLYPHLRDTVNRILIIYISLTVFCFVCLLFGDMDWLTALCHSLSTISTGGFSTLNTNVGSFNDYTQYIIVLFMFLSGISYFLILKFFKGMFKSVAKDEQFRWYVLLILFAAGVFVLYWTFKTDMPFWEKIKDGLFYTVSIISSTGYDIQTHNVGLFVSVAMICLMFIGGCSASSATGLKIIRAILLFKFSKVSLVRIFHPHAIIPVRYNSTAVADEDIRRIFGFFFLYIMIFIAGVFFLCLFGNSLNSSIAMSIANLGNIGPVVSGYISDFSYSSLNISSQITLMFLMMIGRLEIYSFFALFSKSLWRKM